MNPNSKRAFTLIELLVVIAIIAILAAILFPVFAQAKTAAKKAAALSNVKQAGLATILYTDSNDDTFPHMANYDANGTHLGGNPNYRLWAIPAGWGANSAYLASDSVAVHNAVAPFSKNFDIFNNGFSNLYSTGFNYTGAPGNLPIITLSGNGLLNIYPNSGVAAPSQLCMLWWGNGKEAYRGYGYTSPYLKCGGTGPCKFNPGGAPQPNSPNSLSARQDTYEYTFVEANDTTWVMDDGFNYVACDSSAKFVKQLGTGRNSGSYSQPGYDYGVLAGQKGNIVNPARCVSATGAPPYLSWFRPDSTFAYKLGKESEKQPCFQ